MQNIGTGYQTPTIDASTTVLVGHAVDYTDIICESAASELSFTIYPVYAPRIIRDTICQDAQYVGYGIDETFNTPGSFERVVNTLSSNGCDSLVTLVLEVKDKKYNQISDEVCDQYVWNNQTYNTSGTYTQQFTAANGCDSIVTLTLVVNKSVANEFTIETCDSYTWNSQVYSRQRGQPDGLPQCIEADDRHHQAGAGTSDGGNIQLLLGSQHLHECNVVSHTGSGCYYSVVSA